jgi:hypothetical protein
MPTQIYKLNDGTIVPGTTTIIGASLGWGKQRLIGWAYKRGKEGLPMREEVDKACEIGTLAHAMAEADVKGKPPPSTEASPEDIVKKAKAAYGSFLAWKEMSHLTLQGSEIPLVSERLRYGGTLDGIGTVFGRRALVDFKTSNHSYPDHVIQVAAYSWLYEEAHPGDILEGGAHILRFGKELGNFVHYYIPRDAIIDKPMAAFRALRVLYDLQKPIESLI